MATAHEIIEGLKILAQYQIPGGLEELDVCAEHDIICCGPNIKWAHITQEDREKLEELGWHFDDEADSWSRFT